mmetsp:Transcript_3068/g.4664  ORF Transcript_3068/g.4664 Transcript_3068/m.4664 type:complete len:424 (-) Transcript_3068:1236-2507(-)
METPFGEVPKILSFEKYRLDLFCAICSNISLAYTITVALWLIGFGESKPLNFSLIKHIAGSAGIANMTWTFYKHSGSNLDGFKEVLMGAMVSLSLLSAIMTYTRHVRGKEPKFVGMEGKVAIITGANSGIGLETAKGLVERGAHVIMACRNEKRANEAIESITDDLLKLAALERKSEGPTLKGKMTFLKLDLTSLDSVKKFAAEFRKMNIQLDILILNAGVIMGKREETVDGYETTFAVNHLAHFSLANQLLDLMEKSDDGRIVVLTSILYKKPKMFDFDDIQTKKDYQMFKAYSKSKLANVMFGLELNKRLRARNSKIMVNMVHPGMVLSNISQNMPWLMRTCEKLIRPVLVLFRKQPEHGAFTSIFAASDPNLRKPDGSPISGQFYMNSSPEFIAENARYSDDNEKLWRLSEEMCSRKKSK